MYSTLYAYLLLEIFNFRYLIYITGIQTEEKIATWQTIFAYLFMTLFPLCILLFVISLCVICCCCLGKKNKKVEQRPKQVGADGNIRELNLEGVSPRNYGNDITL
jgi:hypothetical protein